MTGTENRDNYSKFVQMYERLDGRGLMVIHLLNTVGYWYQSPHWTHYQDHRPLLPVCRPSLVVVEQDFVLLFVFLNYQFDPSSSPSSSPWSYSDLVTQGCTTYFTDSARNISRREVGVWGLCTQWGLGAKPLVRETKSP